jgi:hypothetical protein
MRAAAAVVPAVMLPRAATERRRNGKRWNCFAKRAEIRDRRGSQGRSEHEFPHGRRITGGAFQEAARTRNFTARHVKLNVRT